MYFCRCNNSLVRGRHLWWQHRRSLRWHRNRHLRRHRRRRRVLWIAAVRIWLRGTVRVRYRIILVLLWSTYLRDLNVNSRLCGGVNNKSLFLNNTWLAAAAAAEIHTAGAAAANTTADARYHSNDNTYYNTYYDTYDYYRRVFIRLQAV